MEELCQPEIGFGSQVERQCALIMDYLQSWTNYILYHITCSDVALRFDEIQICVTNHDSEIPTVIISL